jgi:hypothetical protein
MYGGSEFLGELRAVEIQASSEEMLSFFTRLAMGHLPLFDMYCVLIIPALRAFEAAFPVLQNHLAEIRNVTLRASVQAFIPPSTVRFAPVT